MGRASSLLKVGVHEFEPHFGTELPSLRKPPACLISSAMTRHDFLILYFWICQKICCVWRCWKKKKQSIHNDLPSFYWPSWWKLQATVSWSTFRAASCWTCRNSLEAGGMSSGFMEVSEVMGCNGGTPIDGWFHGTSDEIGWWLGVHRRWIAHLHLEWGPILHHGTATMLIALGHQLAIKTPTENSALQVPWYHGTLLGLQTVDQIYFDQRYWSIKVIGSYSRSQST